MKHKNIYIAELTSSEVILSNWARSTVVEYIPEDCGQKNDLEQASYFSRIHQYLLNYNPANYNFKTVRFSSLDGSLFVNADQAFIEQFPLPSKVNQNFFNYYFDTKNLNDLIIVNCDDYVKINGVYFRIISLFPNYPELTSPNFLASIGDYVIQFKKTNQDAAIKQMEFKRNVFNGSRYKEKRDVEGDNAYYEAETFLENLKKGSEAHFSSEVFIVIKAHTEEELFRKTESMTKFLSSTSLSYIIESESLTELFPSIMFGIEASFKRNIPVDSSYLINLLPLTRDYIHESGSRFFSLDK